MKICHICMVDAFSDGWNYHRNVISDKNISDGHQTVIITTDFRMNEKGDAELYHSGVEYTKSGVKVIRLKSLSPILTKRVYNWFRCGRGLYKTLKKESPDIIMVHNLQFINLSEVTRYKRDYPSVKLLGDTHADKYNALRKDSVKPYIFARYIWRPVIRHNFNYFDRFFYIGFEQKDFFEKMNGLNLDKALLAPLPAPIIDKVKKDKIKNNIRSELKMLDDEILLVHSGKLSKPKKTISILKALSRTNLKCRLLIIGSIPADIKDEIFDYINCDPRVTFLGWKSGEELRMYIAASDLYLQPGALSVTMQNALCVGTPVMIYPHKSYQYYCNGCEFQVTSEAEIKSVFDKIDEDKSLLEIKSKKAYEVAYKFFSLDHAAEMIYEVMVKK